MTALHLTLPHRLPELGASELCHGLSGRHLPVVERNAARSRKCSRSSSNSRGDTAPFCRGRRILRDLIWLLAGLSRSSSKSRRDTAPFCRGRRLLRNLIWLFAGRSPAGGACLDAHPTPAAEKWSSLTGMPSLPDDLSRTTTAEFADDADDASSLGGHPGKELK